VTRKPAPRAKKAPARSAKPAPAPRRPLWRRVLVWAARGAGVALVLVVALVALVGAVDPPQGLYMRQEARRLGGIDQDWVPITDVSPHVGRALVAAEDANFCLHWGFDMAAIRAAIDEGGTRGASTITQQTVKNVFLWHGRTWLRKALEAALTPLVELTWSKRRILEVYMNVAEFDEGVFGIEAAAMHYFDVDSGILTLDQAARLAAVLPDPKGRSAARPSAFVTRRAAAIRSGAETILADGRSACFDG
jgi:monofunctional biosynthetic peptidoglycan transglycosylase